MAIVRKTAIDALLRKPDLHLRASVIHGPDRTRVGEIARTLLARLTADPDDPFSVSVLTDGELSEERLASELAALSLTGARRVVRLRLGELGGKERLVTEALEAHLADPIGSGAFLIVETSPLDKRSTLRKAAEASDAVAALALYEEESGDIGRVARDQLAQAGVTVPPALMPVLLERLPRDLGLARQSLEALVLYLGSGPATLDVRSLDAALPVESAGAGSDVALSAFSGRMDQTVAALSRARFVGESGPALLRFIGVHRAKLARAKAAVDGGVPPQAAVKSAGVFWKEEREVIDQLAIWRADDLALLQQTLLTADAACKTAGAPDELIAHRCALEIARTAGRRVSRLR